MSTPKVEPKVLEIGNIKMGGNPGEQPTVMIGSIFYHGQKIVTDEQKGIFDKQKAEAMINRQNEMSDLTGNPSMIDVVGVSPEALTREIDFVASITKFPLLLDGPVADVRIGAIKRLFEVGLQNRIIYNSLTPDAKPLELETLKECKITTSILLAFNRLDFSLKGRITAIKGKEGQTGLLATAQNIGIQKPLIDTVVLDLPSLSLACQAITELKNELGYPVGCGAHNAIATWRGLKKKMPPEATKPCASFASAVPIMYGSDFILYGPIEDCASVFPVCAMADALTAVENNIRPKETHPLRKIV